MPTILFFALCIGVYLFFKLTTISERSELVKSFWTIILILGGLGWGYHILTTGTL